MSVQKNSKKQSLINSRNEGDTGGTNIVLPPWINPNGTKKTDEEISELGQNWSAKTWNDYLESTVGSQIPPKEEINFFYLDSKIISEGFELLELLRAVEEYEHLHEYLFYALKKLSPREREVIKLKYWQKLTQLEISKKLNIGIESIKTIRKRALKKLKKLLTSKEFQEQVSRLKLLKK